MGEERGIDASDDIMGQFITFPLSSYDLDDPDYLTILENNSWMSKPTLPEQPLDLVHRTFIQDSPTLSSTTELSTRLGTPASELDVLDGSGERKSKQTTSATHSGHTKLDVHNRNGSVSSVTSNETGFGSDPHHEGSCAKCRMTEAEARKCRLERRREQNRASQRKFRARKEAKIREAASQVATLETYVDFLERHNGDLEATNSELRGELDEIKKDVAAAHIKMSRTMVGSETSQRNRPHSSDSSIQAGSPIHGLYLPLFDHDLIPAYPTMVPH